ncbi:MAG: DUF6880 family protein [Rhodobacterales bacterium]
MSKKTLNTANLAALGADRLAELLIEVSTGSADMKRRLRLELSHNLGPAELARDVRKRLVTIRRAKSYVGWRKRNALIKDLRTQSAMIIDKIAPDAPADAINLLWEFLELAPFVMSRVDDSKGDVGAVFFDAREEIGPIAARAPLDPIPLAERTWEAVQTNSDGAFDAIITRMAPSLGETGMAHLKSLIQQFEAAPLDATDDHPALQFLRELRGRSGNYAAQRKRRFIQMHLREIALAQGDTETYISLFSPTDLARPTVAVEVAELWAAQGNQTAALDVLDGAQPKGRVAGRGEWDAAYVNVLMALGREDDAQAHRWHCFAETLDPDMLRAHLKQLPDFDDLEVEEAAKAHAAAFKDLNAAIAFFLAWPDLRGLATMVETRADRLSGTQVVPLTKAADALRSRHPLAAALCWRTMIEATLRDAAKTRYAQAADHLMDCAAADLEIEEYGRFESHDAFVQRLRKRYSGKAAFWTRVT